MRKIINNNSQKIFSFILSLLILGSTLIMMIGNLVYASEKVEKRNENNYWSKNNAPVFYGATKITLEKGSIEFFNIKDSRFRIFAKDFEDGDLTQKITYEENVNLNEVGNYQIIYHVTDKDGNVSTTTVPVIVKEKETEKGNITVERTIYTTPSTWNMDMVGTLKSTYQDRQILGVYVKSGQNIRVRNLNFLEDIRLDFMNNDSSLETSFKIPANGEFVTIENKIDSDSYHGIPLLRTPVLSKENTELSKTYKIEVEYDADIERLQYYHYGDDEAVFKSDWANSGHTYGIIENEAITVVVPYMDASKLTNYFTNGFTSLDNFLDYYKTVIDKMDEYVGLDINPEKITDQNVKTKYLIKADISKFGNSYYYEDHIGIYSYSVASFFEKNTKNLEELAHGYQGSFSKGSMELNEVGNKVLVHYIQNNSDIYTNTDFVLGKLEDIEENYNLARENNHSFVELDDTTKLYMIVNLLDSLEGITTYSKMFSWYREQLSLGNAMTNSDVYVKAIADICGVNIVPYMEAWKIVIADNIKEELYKNDYQFLNITKDMVTESTLLNILKDENMKIKYSLVGNALFHNYDVVGDITLTLDIDDLSKLNGTYIQIKDGVNVIKEVEITSSNMVISLPVGTYYVEMPTISGYRKENSYIKVKEDTNSIYNYIYTKEAISNPNNSIYINIYGYVLDGIALVMDFSADYKNVTIYYPEKTLMSSNEYVKIYDINGNIILEENTKDGYFDSNKGVHNVALEPGYIIEIKYPKKNQKVKFYDTITNKLISEYRMIEDIEFYTVTKDGLKKEDINNTSLSYELLRNYYITVMNTYNETVTEEILNNKNLDRNKKDKVLSIYDRMTEEDRKPYRYLVYRINRGGVPTFTYLGKNEYDITESIDLYSLVSVKDNEDGYIKPIVMNEVDLSIPGEYSITYNATDSDRNVTSYTVHINMVEVLDEIATNVDEEVKPTIVNKKNQRPVPSIGDDTENNSNVDDFEYIESKKEDSNYKLSTYEENRKVQVRSAIICIVVCIGFIICIMIHDYCKNKK